MFSRFAKIFGVMFLIAGIMAMLSIFVGPEFWGPNNWENLLRRTALYGILGIGVAFVIITSGIDLSVGALVCLSACLFSALLTVTYVPFDAAIVSRIDASKQTISISQVRDDFLAGEKIRLNGSRRAGNGVYSITEVGTTNDAEGRVVTAITVKEPLKGNDREGMIAHVYPIEILESEAGTSRINILGDFRDLRPRDQLTLIRFDDNEMKGLKTESILHAESADHSTTVTIAELAEVDESWVGIPNERRQRMPILAGLGLVLLTAMCIGVIHGLLITKLNLQPFIVTLCGFLIYRGLGRWLLVDQPRGFSEHQAQIGFLGAGKLDLFSWGGVTFGIPYPFFFLLVIAILAATFLNLTVWGRYILALGRNEEATRYSGVPTDRLTVVAYVICASLAAIGGILFALDGNSVVPATFGSLFELYAIAAAVLGGCSLRGGEGSIIGVILGTFLMQLIYNMIILLGISETLEYVIIGGVILAAAISDELLRILANRRGSVAGS